MTTPLLPVPLFRAFDSAGLPLAGGLLYTYAANTLTPKNTYSDAAGVQPNTNPVVLDSTGSATIRLIGGDAYKFVLKDSQGTTQWTVDYYQSNYLTQADVAILLNPQTPIEISIGVTPTNYAYPAGHFNRYGNNTTPGTSDMTTALQNAYLQLANGGAPLTANAETYLITDTAFTITATQYRATIAGISQRTIILNKASAGKPTIKITGGQYFDISGLVLIGAAAFPNIGIELVKDGSSTRCGNGKISKIVCQTNGGGIHIQDTNTVVIEDYAYWPSGGSAFGGTIDTNGQPYGILADGTGAVNSVYLKNINISGLNTVANGGCGIKIDGSSSVSYFQDWKIDGLNCETGPVATRRALWFRHADAAILENCFTENMQVLFDDGCVYCNVQLQAGASGTLVLDGTQALGGNSFFTIHDCSGKSFTADSANAMICQINNTWAVSPGDSDSSVQKIRLSTRTTGSVLEPDVLGAAGLQSQKYITSARVTVTYSGTMNVDASAGNSFVITVTDNRAMVVNVVNPSDGQRITITVKVAAGAIGTFTWNANIKMTSWTNPANGFNRVLDIEYDSTDAVWRQVYQSTADIPN